MSTVPLSTSRRRVPKTNKYPGECARCRARIPEDEGEFFSDPLRLVCAACALREGVTDDNGLSERLAAMPIVDGAGREYRLYPFQVEDAQRMATTRAVLNGSQMGTGKTATTAVSALRADRPNFLFCPASVVENWQVEVERWRPDLSVRLIVSQADFAAHVDEFLQDSGRVFIGSFGVLPGNPCRGCVSLKAKLKKLRKWKEDYCPHCDERIDGSQTCTGCNKLTQRRRDGKPEEGKRQKWITFCPRCEGDPFSLKTEDGCLECGGKLAQRTRPRYRGALHGSGCAHAPKRPAPGDSFSLRYELEEEAHHPPYIDLKVDGNHFRLPYHAHASSPDAWIAAGIPYDKKKPLPLDVLPDLTRCRCGAPESEHHKDPDDPKAPLHKNGCKRYKAAFCSGCCQANPQPEVTRSIVLVADECHAFKTPGTQRTKNWRGFRNRVWEAGGYVFGLSGTPCEGKPMEFWEVLVSLGLARAAFGSFTRDYKRIFKDWFDNLKGERKPPQGELLDELHRRLRRVQIQRRRKDVLKQLPPRQEVTVEVDISESMAHDVGEAVHRMLAVKRAWEDVQNAHLHDGVRLMDPFMPHLEPDERDRRRRIYDARVEYYFVERPWNEDEEIAEAVESALLSKGHMPSIEELSRIRAMLSQAKVAAVQEWIENREAEDEPVVLFSQHVSILKKIAKRPGWECFHGGLTSKKRAKMVNRFQSGETTRGLAVSIGAGGEGITLTRAGVCAFIDRSFNPAKNNQAESRLIRIGAEQHKDKAAQEAWDRIARRDFGECTQGVPCCLEVEETKAQGQPGHEQAVAVPCPAHQARIVVVKFVAKHVVDRLVEDTLKEKEALLASLEWNEEEQA